MKRDTWPCVLLVLACGIILLLLYDRGVPRSPAPPVRERPTVHWHLGAPQPGPSPWESYRRYQDSYWRQPGSR